MLRTGIVSLASYIPATRIRAAEIAKFWGGGGSGEHAVCGSDEDVVTMAVAAAEKLLQRSGIAASAIDLLCLATVSGPYAEQPASNVVALAIGAREDVLTADHGGSPRAATTALLDCLGAIESGRARLGLVICSDYRIAEPGSELERTLGAGAVALLVGQEGVSVGIEETTNVTDLFVDRWREDGGEFVKEYDPRFHRQHGFGDLVGRAVVGVCEKAKLSLGDAARVVMAQPHRGYLDCAKALKINSDQLGGTDVLKRFGDLGTASAFMALGQLEGTHADDRVILVNYGAGGADAFVLRKLKPGRLEAADETAAKYLTYDQLVKNNQLMRKEYVIPPLSVPPISPYLWRSRRELLQLVGGKCRACGTVNFPQSLRKICIKCGGVKFTEVKLSRTGKIHTFCVNHYMPDGFDVPLPFIVADMDDGSRYASLGSGVDSHAIQIGDSVRLELRKYSAERGVSTYGYKFVPDV